MEWSPDVDALVLRGPGFVLGFLLWVGLRLRLPKHVVRELVWPLSFLVGNFVLSLLYPLSGGAMWVRALALLLMLMALGGLGFLLVVEVLINTGRSKPIPRIFSDLMRLAVYVAALAVTLKVSNADMSGLFTGTALFTMIIGLALQETLGNFVAGMAIQIQQPFEVGDWIQFDTDNKHIGQVVEINWRATKIYTDDKVELVVPNGPLAKSTVVNFSKPTPLMRRSVYVSAPFTVAPRRIHDAVLSTLRDTPDVLKEPPPWVTTSLFHESSVEYWVQYFIDRFDRRETIDGNVRERIWYALERAELLSGTSNSVPEGELRQVVRQLHAVDFIKALAPEDVANLASRIRKRAYVQLESIIREGDEGDEFFIINRGEVSVQVRGTEVARLKAGQFFGEMSLLTGDKRSATVAAVTEVDVYVVTHSAFDEIIRANPGVLEVISRTLAARQIQLEKIKEQKEDHSEVMEQHATKLLGRIRAFFAVS